MRILGIDPGYAIIGWGILDYEKSRFSVVDYGAITTPAGMAFPQRLVCIDNDIRYILEKYKPEALSMEKLFFTNNKTTGIESTWLRPEAFCCWQRRRRASTSMSTTPSRSSRASSATARPRRNRSWR